MKYKKILLFASALVQIVAIAAFVSGASWLEKAVLGSGLPIGNLLAWLLLTLFPINFLLVQREGNRQGVALKFYYACAYLAVFQGLLWGLVTYYLSGNWAGNFISDSEDSKIWDTYTYITALLPFVGYVGYKVLSVFKKK